MSKIYDLHAHSTVSDGTLSPTELVQRAASQGVDVLALTDHDATHGVHEAQIAAKSCGIQLISGVEISVSWRRQTIHIVGLNVDVENAALCEGLDKIRVLRIERAKRIAQKLEKNGVENAWEACVEMAGCESITRTHFARLIIERGVAPDMKTVFKKWLGRKGKAFVSGEWAELDEAIGWIRAAGGQAIIAHPARYEFTRTKLIELIKDFKAAGGVGLEVITSSHNIAERAAMSIICRDNELLASVGSDFHTPGNPRIELGKHLHMVRDCTPIWDQWPESTQNDVSRIAG